MVTASPAKRQRTTRQVPTRYNMFITGELSVEDLDDEELMKGQLRDHNGSFTGRPPAMIPRSFHVRLTQEMLHRAESKIRENFNAAMDTFVEIMNNPRVRPQDRLYAAQYIWERMAGKIPDQQVVTATVQKWENVAQAVIIEVKAEASDIVDAVLVDDPAAAIAAAPTRPRRPTRKKEE